MNTLIKLYQFLKPIRTVILASIGIYPHACRHTPSCSQYARDAIKKYGTIRGSFYAVTRLLSCRPGTISTKSS